MVELREVRKALLVEADRILGVWSENHHVISFEAALAAYRLLVSERVPKVDPVLRDMLAGRLVVDESPPR